MRHSGGVWPAARAWRWHARQPWLVGCNFTPSTAINQLEMWQADTFDPATIARELALAAATGMNIVRVYLHDLLWHDDAAGLIARFETLLTLADANGIRVMPVLFDSCWHPEPALGPQPEPRPGIHNSGWVQSPGMAVLTDPSRHDDMMAYVAGIVGHFADDPRIIAWDIWNEPDNGPDVAACDPASLAAKGALVAPLLAEAFAVARACRPAAPLTSGIWLGDWSRRRRLSPLQRLQLDNSDIISFHNYGPAEDFARRISWLQALGRPLICTEFMARTVGSTFAAILPLARAAGVGAVCWGLVRGRTQTHLPWDSWHREIAEHEGPWFHDIFDPDGTPHDPQEIALLRTLTGYRPLAVAAE